jgi:hypothetical protein
MLWMQIDILRNPSAKMKHLFSWQEADQRNSMAPKPTSPNGQTSMNYEDVSSKDSYSA